MDVVEELMKDVWGLLEVDEARVDKEIEVPQIPKALWQPVPQ